MARPLIASAAVRCGLCLALTLGVADLGGWGALRGGLLAQGRPAAQTPAFKAGVDVVSVAAVVRDRKGRFVTHLTRQDFDVLDRGERRSIVGFAADQTAPVSVALLVDVSGSMRMSAKLDAARDAGERVLSQLVTGKDEAALYAFDTGLREIQPFTTSRLALRALTEDLHPFGATSLYDAIADTAHRAAERVTRRRAVVVLSDGVDTRSRLTASEVSGIASAVDVPVYVIAVVAPIDHPGAVTAWQAADGSAITGRLKDLATWTGGGLFFVSDPDQAEVAAGHIVAELRHQYLIAFETWKAPGWHPVQVKTRNPKLLVRARTGYIVN